MEDYNGKIVGHPDCQENLKLIEAEGVYVDRDLKWTQLIHAIDAKLTLLAKSFINKGADINKYFGHNKNFPLYFAVEKKDVDISSYILSNGADVNAKTTYGLTALHKACNEKNSNLIKLLINNGANVNAKTVRKATPLHFLCRHKNADMVAFLVQRGADVHAENDQGQTALHVASRYARHETIKYLIEIGASISVKDKAGKTPIVYIQHTTNISDIQVLRCLKIFILKLAVNDFENLPDNQAEINYVKSLPEAHRIFEGCKSELQKMSDITFYRGLTYFSILKMSKDELAKFLVNTDFVTSYKSQYSALTNVENLYLKELDKIWSDDSEIKQKSYIVYTRLAQIFKDYLPYILIKKVASHLTPEDLPIQLVDFHSKIILKKKSCHS